MSSSRTSIERIVIALALLVVWLAIPSYAHAHETCAFDPGSSEKFVLAGGIRWEGREPVDVYLDASRLPDTVQLDDMEMALRATMDRWNAVRCEAPQLRYAGPATNPNPSVEERSVLVVWSTGAPVTAEGLRVLGATEWYCDAEETPCEGRPDERIYHAVVELYAPALPWGVGGCGDETDVEGVLQHELGHVLGLAHSDVTPSVMTARIPAGESWQFRAIRDDDVAGLCALYDCTADDCGAAPDESPNSLCVSCDDDQQCGGPDDLCATSGDAGQALCGTACFGDLDCPEGFACRPEGRGDICSHQCVPVESVCYDVELVQDAPCSVDDECGSAADVCIDDACAVSCEADPAMCPAGTECRVMGRADGTSVPVCAEVNRRRNKGCASGGSGSDVQWLGLLILGLTLRYRRR